MIDGAGADTHAASDAAVCNDYGFLFQDRRLEPGGSHDAFVVPASLDVETTAALYSAAASAGVILPDGVTTVIFCIVPTPFSVPLTFVGTSFGSRYTRWLKTVSSATGGLLIPV